MRYTTMSATSLDLQLVGPGTVVGEDTVPEGMCGLVLSENDDALLVIGSAQQLRDRVYDGLCLPIPADAPLVDVPDTPAELS